MNLRIHQLLRIFKHLVFVGILGVLMILFFFFSYLPSVTNHGESITVPDVVGLPVDILDEVLVRRNLRFEISDSVYSNKHAPLVVLQQYPKPGSKVKENRKIYISINRKEPPQIALPAELMGSLRNAQAVLASYELRLGKIIYKPDLAFNLVLEVRHNGEVIEPGTKLPKGAVIDLVVGDGLGKDDFEIQNLVGMDFYDAWEYLNGTGLLLGSVINSGDSTFAPGVVVRQVPSSGSRVRVGQNIDLWVQPRDSVQIQAPVDSLLNSDDREEG